MARFSDRDRDFAAELVRRHGSTCRALFMAPVEGATPEVIDYLRFVRDGEIRRSEAMEKQRDRVASRAAWNPYAMLEVSGPWSVRR
jgi:hypothetical protein